MPDCRKIRLVVLDVDGTMTDGGIIYDSAGGECKRFDVKDGLAMKAAQTAGLAIGILTGRESPMVQRRAQELAIEYLVEGAQSKYSALRKLLSEKGYLPEEVCYIGDDWNDLQCMQSVGLSMCPADAAGEVRSAADYVAAHNGGHGAVRECLEYLMKSRGDWEKSCRKLYFE